MTKRRIAVSAIVIGLAGLSDVPRAGAVDVYHDIAHFSTGHFRFKSYFNPSSYPYSSPSIASGGFAGAPINRWQRIGRRTSSVFSFANAVQHLYGQFTDANDACISLTATLYRFQTSTYGDPDTSCSVHTWTGVVSATASIDTCGSVGMNAADFYYRVVDLALNFSSDGAPPGFKGYKWSALVRLNADPALTHSAEGCFVIKWD